MSMADTTAPSLRRLRHGSHDARPARWPPCTGDSRAVLSDGTLPF